MAPPARKTFVLRIDPALHAAVERLAGVELRSVNAQIEFLLREALQRRGVRAQAGQVTGADGGPAAASGPRRDAGGA